MRVLPEDIIGVLVRVAEKPRAARQNRQLVNLEGQLEKRHEAARKVENGNELRVLLIDN